MTTHDERFADRAARAVSAHVERFFPGRQVVAYWPTGPIRESIPRFSVLLVEPGTPENYPVYLTRGASVVHSQSNDHAEFLLEAPRQDEQLIELLAMVANFHADPQYNVGIGHILEIGKPWLPGSKCDHLLVSLPYLYGPKFEWRDIQDGGQIRFLWLLPITRSEADYMRREGQEALEQRFEDLGIDVVDPHRRAAV